MIVDNNYEEEMKLKEKVFLTWRSKYKIKKCFSCSQCSMKVPCDTIEMSYYCSIRGLNDNECFGGAK